MESVPKPIGLSGGPSELDGPGGRHGLCSVSTVRGREAVMPLLQLELDLAECEDLCSLREELMNGS